MHSKIMIQRSFLESIGMNLRSALRYKEVFQNWAMLVSVKLLNQLIGNSLFLMSKYKVRSLTTYDINSCSK